MLPVSEKDNEDKVRFYPQFLGKRKHFGREIRLLTFSKGHPTATLTAAIPSKCEKASHLQITKTRNVSKVKGYFSCKAEAVKTIDISASTFPANQVKKNPHSETSLPPELFPVLCQNRPDGKAGERYSILVEHKEGSFLATFHLFEPHFKDIFDEFLQAWDEVLTQGYSIMEEAHQAMFRKFLPQLMQKFTPDELIQLAQEGKEEQYVSSLDPEQKILSHHVVLLLQLCFEEKLIEEKLKSVSKALENQNIDSAFRIAETFEGEIKYRAFLAIASACIGSNSLKKAKEALKKVPKDVIGRKAIAKMYKEAKHRAFLTSASACIDSNSMRRARDALNQVPKHVVGRKEVAKKYCAKASFQDVYTEFVDVYNTIHDRDKHHKEMIDAVKKKIEPLWIQNFTSDHLNRLVNECNEYLLRCSPPNAVWARDIISSLKICAAAKMLCEKIEPVVEALKNHDVEEAFRRASAYERVVVKYHAFLTIANYCIGSNLIESAAAALKRVPQGVAGREEIARKYSAKSREAEQEKPLPFKEYNRPVWDALKTGDTQGAFREAEAIKDADNQYSAFLLIATFCTMYDWMGSAEIALNRIPEGVEGRKDIAKAYDAKKELAEQSNAAVLASLQNESFDPREKDLTPPKQQERKECLVS